MRKFLSIALILLFASNSYADTIGGLMITPTRIIFEGKTRSQVINLINRSNKESTYRISLKNMSVDSNGRYEDIEIPIHGEKFADKMIRYSPRQVTLKPHQVQKVRLLLRKPANLELGEYRSHLLFAGVPPKDFGHNIEGQSKDEIEIKLIPIYGISIPVIVRHGQLSAQTKISDISLNADDNTISLSINRTGEASVYGSLEILQDGKILAQRKGVSVLHPYDKVNMTLKLSVDDDIDLDASKIIVNYYGTDKKLLATNTPK